jgi:hypothetical protein
MPRTRFSLLFLAAWLLPIEFEDLCGAQDPTVVPLTIPSANLPAEAARASLKVRLRLEDESPFLGAVSMRLMPEEGYEIIGTPTGNEGEMQFAGLEPGKYTVEASAPGYLSVRRSTQIEAGHGQRILYVVMKPRPIVQNAEKKQGDTTFLAALPAVFGRSKTSDKRCPGFRDDARTGRERAARPKELFLKLSSTWTEAIVIGPSVAGGEPRCRLQRSGKPTSDE